MTSNVTLRMDDDLLQKLKHRAVDERMSVSAWATSVLRRQVEQDTAISIARRRAVERLDQGYSLGGTPLKREQAHER